MKRKQLKYLDIVLVIAQWIFSWFFPTLPFSPLPTLIRVKDFLIRFSKKERGLLNAVEQFKLQRQLFISILKGECDYKWTLVLPRQVIKHCRNGNTEAIRFVFTIFMITRPFRRSGIPDLNDITSKPSDESFDYKDFERWLEKWKPELDMVSEFKPHYTTNAGPQGPAFATCYADLRSLPKDLLEAIAILHPELYNNIIEHQIPYSEMQGIKVISDTAVKRNRRGLIRLLSIVNDREMKLRPVAILDYWSQASLKPLHDGIFKMLKYIKSDFTFDQTKGCKHLLSIKRKGMFYSLDLKSATDRFPIALQRLVLNRLIGNDKAEAWVQILTKYPYTVSPLIPSAKDQDLIFSGKTEDEIKEIKQKSGVVYACGQPMGAYSSWAVFTLTHHLLVKYSARDINYEDYAMLGDDIVLTSDEVAATYMKNIAALGVEISKPKTIISNDMFEFAKRFYYKGKEVSGFPMLSVIKSYKSVTGVVSVLSHEAASRGYYPPSWWNRQMVEELWADKKNKWDLDTVWKHWTRSILFPLMPNSLGNKAIRFYEAIGIKSCHFKASEKHKEFFQCLYGALMSRTYESYDKSQCSSQWINGQVLEEALAVLNASDKFDSEADYLETIWARTQMSIGDRLTDELSEMENLDPNDDNIIDTEFKVSYVFSNFHEAIIGKRKPVMELGLSSFIPTVVSLLRDQYIGGGPVEEPVQEEEYSDDLHGGELKSGTISFILPEDSGLEFGFKTKP